MIEFKRETVYTDICIYIEAIENLMGLSEGDDPCAMKSEEHFLSQQDHTVLGVFHTTQTILYMYFGDYESGAKLAIERDDTYSKGVPSHTWIMFETFARGMCLVRVRKTCVNSLKYCILTFSLPGHCSTPWRVGRESGSIESMPRRCTRRLNRGFERATLTSGTMTVCSMLSWLHSKANWIRPRVGINLLSSAQRAKGAYMKAPWPVSAMVISCCTSGTMEKRRSTSLTMQLDDTVNGVLKRKQTCYVNNTKFCLKHLPKSW